MTIRRSGATPGHILYPGVAADRGLPRDCFGPMCEKYWTVPRWCTMKMLSMSAILSGFGMYSLPKRQGRWGIYLANQALLDMAGFDAPITGGF